MQITPSETSPESNPFHLVGQQIRIDHNDWQVVKVDSNGRGVQLRMVNPNERQNLMEGQAYGRYMPIDKFNESLAESGSAQTIAKSTRKNIAEQTDRFGLSLDKMRIGDPLPNIVLWTDELGYNPTLSIGGMDNNNVYLANENRQPAGSIDRKTLQNYMNEGDRLRKRYQTFVMKSEHDPSTLYYACRVIGINIANGKLVVAGSNEQNQGFHKPFDNESHLNEVIATGYTKLDA